MDRAPKRVVSVGAGTATTLLMVALLAGGLCNAKTVNAATIYVRTAGNDANSGAAPAVAVRTITRAAVLARAGDRIVVGPGKYTEGNITPADFGQVSFVADRRGIEVGEPPGDVVVDARNFASGFELNRKLATTIDGFVIYGATIGIYVKSQSDQAVISNNLVSGNSGKGINVEDSKGAVVFNNLVYANGSSGILVAGNVSGSRFAKVVNNTVYGNGNRGIFFAGTTIGSTDGLVLNNIVQGNVTSSNPSLTIGIQINAVSRSGYLSAGNVAADRFARGTPSDVTDVGGDPLFVNPAGPDQKLGGPNYADDAFHLSQKAAGQAVDSPAVDAGSDRARRMKLSRATTRTDGRPDLRFVDAGYHYRNSSAPPVRPELFLRSKPLYVSAAHGKDANDGATVGNAVSTVQRALQAAAPGHRILLLPGTYAEGQLTFANSGKQGRTIILQGMDGAVIDATGSARGLLLSGRSDITIVGLEIKNATDSGIEIRNGSSYITLSRCHLHDNARRGLYVNGVTAITAQSMLIEHNGSKGIQATGGQLDVRRSSIRNNVEHGLWAIDDAAVTVTGSDLSNNTKSGVLADNSRVTITDSTISGNQDDAARFTGGATGTLTRVAVTDNAGAGVQGLSSVVNISGGTVQSNRHGGIDAGVDTATPGANKLAVSGTRVCSNQGPGVRAQDTAVTLVDVTLCQNTEDGLRQTSGSLVITRATASENRGKGLSVAGADEVMLHGAQISNNADHGVQIASGTAGAEISGATVFGNAGDGLIAVVTGGTVTVSNSAFSDNLKSGILADESAVTLIDSTVSGSKQGGVRFTNGSTGTLTRVAITDNTGAGVQGLSSTVSMTDGSVERSSSVGIESVINAARGGTGDLTVTGTRVCNNNGVGIRAVATPVTLTDVTLCANAGDGVRQDGASLAITRATVTQNQNKGISVSAAPQFVLQGAAISHNGDNGLQVVGAGTTSIGGCMSYQNRGSGITILDSRAPVLWNNLVYANCSMGMQISGGVTGSPNAQVLNNTFYGNADPGLLIGGSNEEPPSAYAQVLRNIFQSNRKAGVQVNELSLPGYVGDYNLNVDAYVPTRIIGAHDLLRDDPRLVRPVASSCGVGGADTTVGDFHLSPSSPAVDAGGVDVVTARLQGTTTRTDGAPDTGTVDLGYHYTP